MERYGNSLIGRLGSARIIQWTDQILIQETQYSKMPSNLLLQLQAWYLRTFTYKGKTFWYCDCSEPKLLQIYTYTDGKKVIYLGNNQAAYT